MRKPGFVISISTFVLLLVSSAISQAAEKENGKRGALPEIDRHSERSIQAPRALSPSEEKLVRPGKRIQYEERLGVPTFLWAAPSSAAELKARAARVSGATKDDITKEARRSVAAYASFYGLQKGDIASAKVTDVQDTGSGAIIVRFQKDIGGIEVFREELSVMMDRSLEPIAFSGYLSGVPKGFAEGPASFRIDEREAVAVAVSDRTGGSTSRAEFVATGARQGPYGFVDQEARMKRTRQGAPPDSESALTEPVRYKQVYFHTADGFEPAYYLEVSAELRDAEGNLDSDMYSYVVSATDGRILFRHNLTVNDNFSYRVFADTTDLDQPMDSPQGTSGTPHPTGLNDSFVPPFVSPNQLNLQNVPGTISDPWLPAGATETNGNNADAFANLFSPDGFSAGDFRADITAPGVFDRVYDTTLTPNASVDQQKAAVTNLFYVNNFLHDWYYVAGFDEVARNAQKSNFGRGGLEGDDIRAQAQDFSGTNNANMSTPADGGRPRMRMYVFSGPSARHIDINSQPGGGTLLSTYPASRTNISTTFGAQSFDVSADVVRTIPFDGCSAAISNGAELAGKIAFIDRGGSGGTCAGGFAQKTFNAQDVGAIGVIIANVSTSGSPTIAPGMGGVNAAVTIGALSLNFADGEDFRNTIALGPVNLRLFRFTGTNRDGDLDNQVIEHEWGHYITNRLVGNGAGLGNQQGGGMGEGWGDFNAMLLTVRPEDITVQANANWSGVYTMGAYASIALSSNSYYFGIRRLPYSTDMTKDPLTFKHIQNGVALPCGSVPIDFGCDGSSNAEVHNTGEVWSTMLWECLTSLLNNHPFDVARDRMRNYLVASLKMTPVNPTFTEARDALLAAAFAADPADHALFCAAFAKRGAGTFAVSPDRFSGTNTPVVESYECANFMTFQGASLSAPTDSCDTDSYLDNTEVGTLTVTYKNIGGTTLSNTTANISSTNPNIYFSNGGVISFPPSAPFQTTTGTISVGMANATGIQDFYIDIAGHDTAISASIPDAHLDVRGNANDVASSSASDNVEARLTPWSSTGNTNGTWVRQQFLPSPPALPPPPFSYAWHSPDQGAVSDIRLESPVIHVGPGGTTFTFNHRYSFENTFDGGVVETSIDGGASWQDIGAANLSPTYALAPLVAGSPLQGRRAYTGNSAGYPALVPVTGTLGVAFENLDVRIRFRAASDGGVGGPGWDVDDIVFANITNTPFSTVVAQPANPAVDALSPAHAWVGVKNGNDVGVNFDLMAEVFRNGVLIGTGQVNDVSGLSTGFNGAKDQAIDLALSSPGASGACAGDTLSIKLSVRVAATGKSSGTARLWYNDPQANTRFGVTIAGVSSNLYLLNGFVLGTSPGPVGQRLNIDVSVNRNGGNPWKTFGTWVKTF